mmetsp:Transcript_26156/g.71735  ORF Transcript_26156/g.71735 Transcript_26156/m.71735 type:complete len:135 (+) Transcript_26156:725-1129(+)
MEKGRERERAQGMILCTQHFREHDSSSRRNNNDWEQSRFPSTNSEYFVARIAERNQSHYSKFIFESTKKGAVLSFKASIARAMLGSYSLQDWIVAHHARATNASNPFEHTLCGAIRCRWKKAACIGPATVVAVF